MMSLILAALIGLLAGTHTATWGMYKDAPHEGFEARKYLRSILLSGMIAPAVVLGYPLHGSGGMIVLFGVTYVLERAISEFYKTFIRSEDQSKYAIPMQFAVFGRIVQQRRVRMQVGLATVLVGAALLAGVSALQHVAEPPHSWPLILAVGSLGGWFSAIGGAWKDAPIEGFETLKFLRSPLLAAILALVLSSFTTSLPLLALASLGFTIAMLETYKTFLFPSRPRGKFAGKPILFPAMLARRTWFVPLFAGIWGLLAAGFVAGAFGWAP
jgi:hypothetical protein